MVLKKTELFQRMKNFTMNFDKGFIFPILLIVFGFITYVLTWSFVETYIVLLIFSMLHSLLLVFFPYVKTSEYYSYLALKEEFIEKNKTVPDLVSKTQKSFSFYSIIFLFLLMEKFLVLSDLFFIIQLFFFSIIFFQNLIEIYNLVRLPRLPDTILNRHPLYVQKRHAPYFFHIMQKVGTQILPVCARVAQTGFAGLGVLAGGWKYVNGAEAMDPVRMRLINYVHKLPPDVEWTEGDFLAYKRYHEIYTETNPKATHAESYEGYKKITAATRKVLKELIQKKIKVESLDDNGDV